MGNEFTLEKVAREIYLEYQRKYGDHIDVERTIECQMNLAGNIFAGLPHKKHKGVVPLPETICCRCPEYLSPRRCGKGYLFYFSHWFHSLCKKILFGKKTPYSRDMRKEEANRTMGNISA